VEPEPKEIIVLGAIKHGIKKFDKIQKITQIEPKELNSILEQLEKSEFIQVEEKKGWIGTKIEIIVTQKGSNEVDEQIQKLQSRWNQMSSLYKTGDKEKMKQSMDENKSFFPTMMFFGVMDLMMFSMMFSMMGMAMTDYVPVENIPEGEGMDSGDAGTDGDGFDFDIGF
jgi:DNA-binding HxlR family transcriptional regulator